MDARTIEAKKVIKKQSEIIDRLYSELYEAVGLLADIENDPCSILATDFFNRIKSIIHPKKEVKPKELIRDQKHKPRYIKEPKKCACAGSGWVGNPNWNEPCPNATDPAYICGLINKISGG